MEGDDSRSLRQYHSTMCKERYINPFTDFGFKLLFGTPANKEFLIAILNSILDRELPIVDISYNNTEVFGKSPDDRKAIYDLYCETSDGSHIIVEMQNAYNAYEASLKNMRDYNNTINSAEYRGRLEGKAEGLEEGGKNKAIEIAARMKEMGMPAEDIAQFTGLSEIEINAL